MTTRRRARVYRRSANLGHLRHPVVDRGIVPPVIGRARLVVITSTLISVLSLSAGCSTDRSSVPAAPSSTANSQGADNQAGAPVSYTHLTLPTTPYV